ncbi:MAG: NAD-dependent succinate-semialdehyde dehydrogenase [SAR324 cluster bacterium]|nr:NAD-dependent succinate-semialdehyde dehydrogenase [SAR324 cluster bacterium]
MTISLNDTGLFRSQCYIGGKWISGNGAGIEVVNPATGKTIGSVPSMGAHETKEAIAAAHEAFGAWRAATAKERSVIMKRWYDLIVRHQKDLAVLMTTEQGKPLTEAMGEVLYAASFIEWFAEEAKRAYGETIPSHKSDARIIVSKEPVGVVAAITPWNFPIAMIARKIGPALAVGCTMVFKPDPQTPFSAFALAYLAEQAGIPPGVFNVVTGPAEAIGGELTSNPIVRKLTFTGSTAVGKLLLRQCADTVKKVSMELGGNAPYIVFEDADLDKAVEGAMIAKFRNTGQTCVCANRFYVQASVYDQFVEKLAHKVSELKIGNGMEEGVAQGPLINQTAVEKVERHIQNAVQNGATVVQGGKRHGLGGTFFEPTILSHVKPSMLVCKEETFGPLAAVIKFTTEEEVVAMANDTQFGLAAYFYSRDIGRAWRVSEALEYGMVGVNEGLVSTEIAPFGGYKESGLGREGSKYGLDDYTEIKYTLMGGID